MGLDELWATLEKLEPGQCAGLQRRSRGTSFAFLSGNLPARASRMAAIVSSSKGSVFLPRSVLPVTTGRPCISPLTADWPRIWPVDRKVNKISNDGLKLLEP
jgi:hypothetical protein